jgi:hypothetical protein
MEILVHVSYAEVVKGCYEERVSRQKSEGERKKEKEKEKKRKEVRVYMHN